MDAPGYIEKNDAGEYICSTCNDPIDPDQEAVMASWVRFDETDDGEIRPHRQNFAGIYHRRCYQERDK